MSSLSVLLTIFIIAPWLTALPASIFGVAYWRHKTKSAIAAALLWVVYGFYESLMYLRILCSGECNIRIDLLMFYPVLLGTSLLAIVITVKVIVERRREPQAREEKRSF